MGHRRTLRFFSLSLLVLVLAAMVSSSSIRNTRAIPTLVMGLFVPYGELYPGGTVTFDSTFYNVGETTLRVTGQNVSASFGNFRATAGLPVTLIAYGTNGVDLNVRVTIPSTASPGQYNLRITTSYEYYSALYSRWFVASDSPTIYDSTVTLSQAPQSPPPQNPTTPQNPNNPIQQPAPDSIPWIPLLVGVGVVAVVGLYAVSSKRKPVSEQAGVEGYGPGLLPSTGGSSALTYCESCGRPVQPDSKFCQFCGSPRA